MIAEVIIDIANKQVNRSFDYEIPSLLENIIKVGYRVYVPFGSQKRMGFVIRIKETSDVKRLKMIEDTIDVYPILNEEFIDLAMFIAKHNFSFYATALQTMIPSALKLKYRRVGKVLNYENMSAEAKRVFKRKEFILDSLSADKMCLVYEEVKKGNIVLDTQFKKKKETTEETVYVVLKDTDKVPISNQGKKVVSYLQEIEDKVELSILIEDCGFSKGVLHTLEKNGVVSLIRVLKPKEEIEKSVMESKVELNAYQQKAFDSVKFFEYRCYLLHGVCGSGKTELYMRWIEMVLRQDKSAILLVPEIALTPQITYLFRERFHSNVAILHSRLTTEERYKEWKRIYNDEVRIVIGARSAIFAPLKNLGIILVDECHESTYIQQNNPKYNALEIARMRGKYHRCPVVLGSATPNVIDYYKAMEEDMELLRLPYRANYTELPKTMVVDMRRELEMGNRSVFSQVLQDKLVDCYRKKEQSILFLNRRGYHSFVMCRSCGEVVKCPNCDVALTYHASKQVLQCHYCGYQIYNTTRCEKCGSDKIRYLGSGTERICAEAQRLLPEAKILRLDLDMVHSMQDYEDVFHQFRNNEADILIGTQMITKGLDFKNVTLVGVVNADLALYYPTYDATMVAFNLIEQVAGRCGRADKKGNVVIQTYQPNHYVIETAAKHDYERFYSFEIQKRKLGNLPPFSTILDLQISSEQADLAYREAQKIAHSIQLVSKTSSVLGPTEGYPFKKNNVFSFHVQVIVTEEEVMDKVQYIYPLYQAIKDVNLTITRVG